MNNIAAFAAWALAIFIWIYMMPILFVGTLMCLPFFLVVTPPLMLISFTWFYLVKDSFIPDGAIRSILNNLQYDKWFRQRMTFGTPSTPHLITSHPHGVLCTAVLFGIHLSPKSTTRFAVSPWLFSIPLFGWVAHHAGCIPATYDRILHSLESSSVILVPGGVPELVTGVHYERRHGFIKIAKQSGVPILPIVSPQRYFDILSLPLQDLRVYIAKTFGIPIMFPPMGWYGTWLPKRQPITFHVADVFTVSSTGDIEEERQRYYSKIHKWSAIQTTQN